MSIEQEPDLHIAATLPLYVQSLLLDYCQHARRIDQVQMQGLPLPGGNSLPAIIQLGKAASVERHGIVVDVAYDVLGMPCGMAKSCQMRMHTSEDAAWSFIRLHYNGVGHGSLYTPFSSPISKYTTSSALPTIQKWSASNATFLKPFLHTPLILASSNSLS